MKPIKITVTKEMQEELNKIRKQLGLEEKPIIKEYKLNALCG